jgi:diguanylate cyclase (GGDEF)-like protein
LRQSLGASLEREPGSPLLVRASLEALLDAFTARAQQTRGEVGLVAFELEDWKSLHERVGASAFARVFADLGSELRRRVRVSDDLGRLGEAQIAVILPGCELQALGSVSERLRSSLEARELSLGPEPFRASFATAWLAAPPGPTRTSTRGPTTRS